MLYVPHIYNNQNHLYCLQRQQINVKFQTFILKLLTYVTTFINLLSVAIMLPIKVVKAIYLLKTNIIVRKVWNMARNINKCVGFEVLTAVSTKMAVFWVVAPCSLVEFYQRFRGPDDGGSKDLWNTGKLLPDYTALQPRRQPSSINVFTRTTIYNKQHSENTESLTNSLCINKLGQ
jgi:hypothetical protein